MAGFKVGTSKVGSTDPVGGAAAAAGSPFAGSVQAMPRLARRPRPGHIQRGIMEDPAPGIAPAPILTNGRRRSMVAVTATVAVNLLLTTLGSQPTTVQATVATHAYAAQAPKVSVRVAVPAASHAYTAVAPQARAAVAPAPATHVYTGRAPALGAAVQPGPVSHSYTAVTPQVRARVQPGAVTHVYSGVVPALDQGVAPVRPPVWQNPQRRRAIGAPLAFSQPVSAGGTTVGAPVATHAYAAQAPQVRARVQPGAVTHVYTGRIPTGLGAEQLPFNQLSWPLPRKRAWTPVPKSWRPDLAEEQPPVGSRVLPNPQRKRSTAYLQRTGGTPALRFTAGTVVVVPVATHAYAGQAPKLQSKVQPAQATHTYVAQAPQARASVKPGQVTHTYTGRAPQLKPRVQPAQATHSYTGHTPALNSGAGFTAPAAVHSYTARAPQARASVRPPLVLHVYTAKVPQYVAQIAYTSRPLRARIGSTPDVDTHTRIGTTPAVDTNERIGPEVGVAATKRIGDPAK